VLVALLESETTRRTRHVESLCTCGTGSLGSTEKVRQPKAVCTVTSHDTSVLVVLASSSSKAVLRCTSRPHHRHSALAARDVIVRGRLSTLVHTWCGGSLLSTLHCTVCWTASTGQRFHGSGTGWPLAFHYKPGAAVRRARLLSSVGVLELAGIQCFVNLLRAHRLEVASTLGTAAALHWLGVRETDAARAVVYVSHQVDH
jgi:hypothetical protein